MSVHQLKDGRWICKFPKGYHPSDANKTRQYFGRAPCAEEQAWEFNEKIGLGEKPTDTTGPMFNEVARAYIKSRTSTISESSINDMVYKLRGYIGPFFNDTFASAVTHAMLDQYVSERKAAGRKNTSIHKELTIIRAILRWGTKRGMLLKCPFDGYQMPRRDDAVIVPPTEHEFREILKVAAPHLKRAILISYFTGLRPGAVELLSLTWDKVDLHAGVIYIESANKGGLRQRVVPLNPVLKQYMEKWLENDNKESHIVHYRGKPITSIKTAWKSAKKKAKITRRLRMYDFRHLAATNMLEAGEDLKSVSEILGHSSTDMTTRIYQHVSNAKKRSAVNSLGNPLSGYKETNEEKTG